MLREPRGYPAANCNLVLPPTQPEATAGYVIMEQTEYPGMSGTNTICVTTVLLETGMVPMREPVTELTLESPAGLIRVRAECSGGKVRQVTFRNVPAFAVHLDRPIDVPHLGTVTVDVAYGGMFYVIAEAAPFGLRLVPEEGREIVRIGEMIKAAAREQLPAVHPEQPGFAGVTIAILTAPPTHLAAHSRNAVIVSTGQLDWDRPATWTGAIDRSPCGTGTCAGWLRCTPRAGCASTRTSTTRGSWGRSSPAGCSRRRRSDPIAPLCRPSAAGPGSPALPATSWRTTTRSRRDSPWATSGEPGGRFARSAPRRDMARFCPLRTVSSGTYDLCRISWSVGIRPSACNLESGRAGRGPTRDILREGAAMERTRVNSPEADAAGRTRAGGLALALILALIAAKPGTARGQAPAVQKGAGAAQASLARYVPKQDNLFFYFELDGLDAHSAAWKNSAAYKLLNDTKLGALLEDLTGQGLELMQQSAPPDRRVKPAELIGLFKLAAKQGFAAGFWARIR